MTTGTELHPGTPQEAGLDPVRLDRVRDLCRTWVKEGIHPAIGVIVARHGVVALHETYGKQGPEDDAPDLPLDAVWWLASITKTLTATAVMQLVEDGLVALMRPVQQYIPEFVGFGKEDVCVHHLLTHTSGLRDDDLPNLMYRVLPHLNFPSADDTQHPFLQLRLLTGGFDWPLYRPPGEEMWYCNLNFDLLGEIVRRVSGSSLGDFARRRIFEPLGMKDTSYGLPDEMVPRYVRQSTEGLPPFFQLMMSSRDYQRAPFPFSGGFSTLTDMASFAQTFLNGGAYGSSRILSPFIVGEMTRDQIPGVGARIFQLVAKEASWSYGWGIAAAQKWPIFPTLPLGSFHHGGGGGTWLWGDPSHDIVGAYFAMSSYGSTDDVSRVDLITQVDLFMNAVMASVTN